MKVTVYVPTGNADVIPVTAMGLLVFVIDVTCAAVLVKELVG
jgi:hypothetical protein